MQRSFDMLPEDLKLKKTIVLKDVKIHIVGHCGQYDFADFRDPNKRVVGYATTNNEIWVIGKRVNGKIIINQIVLGHELAHLLSYQDLLGMISPDLYDPLLSANSASKNICPIKPGSEMDLP